MMTHYVDVRKPDTWNNMVKSKLYREVGPSDHNKFKTLFRYRLGNGQCLYLAFKVQS